MPRKLGIEITSFNDTELRRYVTDCYYKQEMDIFKLLDKYKNCFKLKIHPLVKAEYPGIEHNYAQSYIIEFYYLYFFV